MYQKAKPIRNEQYRAEYLRSHPYCQACGIPWHEAERANLFGLAVHHIIRFRRSDEACNFLVSCLACHMCYHGAHKIGGVEYPEMGLGVQLTIKRMHDAANWDDERLTQLRGQALPDLEPIPDMIAEMWAGNRPSCRIVWTTKTK